ncbi:hypothetical protein ABH944_002395 [Caballeronia udeis]|jgi:hypothetical protein|uniref:Uncharacterized protein n=1 Tax=Caballeronia udeis TaxID=1232866 RepID=A0ABW8ME45_9BURK
MLRSRVSSIKGLSIAARKTSAMRDPGPKQHAPFASQPVPIPRKRHSHDLKTTLQIFAKECILKINCIVNIILSNELRAKAPPETMF